MASLHSTNYVSTLICPAEDCKTVAKVPTKPDTIAGLQYQRISAKPYGYTSDEVLVYVATIRSGGSKDVFKDGESVIEEAFFAKGQPCFRASPLTKTHGWAIHADEQGRIALVDPGSTRFRELKADNSITKVAAMRNRKA